MWDVRAWAFWLPGYSVSLLIKHDDVAVPCLDLPNLSSQQGSQRGSGFGSGPSWAVLPGCALLVLCVLQASLAVATGRDK